jgi:hypothetical protein
MVTDVSKVAVLPTFLLNSKSPYRQKGIPVTDKGVIRYGDCA